MRKELRCFAAEDVKYYKFSSTNFIIINFVQLKISTPILRKILTRVFLHRAF